MVVIDWGVGIGTPILTLLDVAYLFLSFSSEMWTFLLKSFSHIYCLKPKASALLLFFFLYLLFWIVILLFHTHSLYHKHRLLLFCTVYIYLFGNLKNIFILSLQKWKIGSLLSHNKFQTFFTYLPNYLPCFLNSSGIRARQRVQKM